MKNKIIWKVLEPDILIYTPVVEFGYLQVISKRVVIYTKIARERANLIIDFSQVEYTDFTAVRLLLGIKEVIDKMGKSMCLCNLSPPVKNLLRASGSTELFISLPSVEDAVKYIKTE